MNTKQVREWMGGVDYMSVVNGILIAAPLVTHYVPASLVYHKSQVFLSFTRDQALAAGITIELIGALSLMLFHYIQQRNQRLKDEKNHVPAGWAVVTYGFALTLTLGLSVGFEFVNPMTWEIWKRVILLGLMALLSLPGALIESLVLRMRFADEKQGKGKKRSNSQETGSETPGENKQIAANSQATGSEIAQQGAIRRRPAPIIEQIAANRYVGRCPICSFASDEKGSERAAINAVNAHTCPGSNGKARVAVSVVSS